MKSSLFYTIALLICMAVGSMQGMDQEFKLCSQFGETLKKLVNENDLAGVKTLCAQDTKMVKRLTSSHASSDAYNALTVAINNNQIEMVKFLISTFAPHIDLRVRCASAAREGINQEILDCIVEQLQKKHPKNWRAHLAYGFYGNDSSTERVAQRLINAGADLNARIWLIKEEEEIATPLHLKTREAITCSSEENPHLPIIALLVENGALSFIQNDHGKNALDICDSERDYPWDFPVSDATKLPLIKDKHPARWLAVRRLLAPKKELYVLLPMFSRDLAALVAEYV